MDVLQAYVRDAALFWDHAGAGLRKIGPSRMMSMEQIENFRSLKMESAGRTVSLPNKKPDSKLATSRR
jgi:hypothetical protein